MPVLTSILLAETVALGVLLICGVLVHRTFPQRYLLIWNTGWLLYLGHLATVGFIPGSRADLLSVLPLLGGCAAMTASLALAAGSVAAPAFLWTVVGVGSAADILVGIAMPRYAGVPSIAAYLILGVPAAYWAWAAYRRSRTNGSFVLAVGMMLRLLHPSDWLVGEWRVAAFTYSAFAAGLPMLGMLAVVLGETRQHLRWTAAPGLITSAAANAVSEERSGLTPMRIEDHCARVFEADFCRLHMARDHESNGEAAMLKALLPRPAEGGSLCSTVIDGTREDESAEWLRHNRLRWAVVVPIPHAGQEADWELAGLLVIGYRDRASIAPGAMQALWASARQIGIVLENATLLRKLSHAYRELMNTMDAINDFIIVHDSSYHIQRVNRAMAERIGCPPARLIGMACAEVLPAHEAKAWTACPFCEMSGGADTWYPALGGYLTVSTARYPREHPSGILHVVRDINDRKKAEEKYRTLFETVREGVFIGSIDGRFETVNEAMASMLGYTREELLAIEDVSVMYDDPQDRALYVSEIRRNGYVNDYELRLRRKNGETLIALESSSVTRDEHGQPSRVQGLVLDVTARKLAEQRLHQHVNMLSAINDLAGQLSGSLEVDTLLETVGRGMRAIFGCDLVSCFLVDVAAASGKRVLTEGSCRPAGGREAPYAIPPGLLESLLEEKRPVLPLSALRLPPEMVVEEREERVESAYVMTVRAPNVLALVAIAWRRQRELTPAETNLLDAVVRQLHSAIENAQLYQQTRRAYDELQRTQEQLLQSEKMAAIGQLVSGVAHELNNPLTAIIGYSQLLGTLVDGKASDYTEKVLQQARRTQRIIQNLLSFARQRKPERNVIQLNAVIEETLQLRDYEFRARNITVARDLHPALPLVWADVHQLEQVFLNIVNNAFDAIVERNPERGEIRVRTALDGQCAVVEFSDNGTGMQDPARVFDPFYTTKSVGKGTGLGLSICYGIINEHGGNISAFNNAGGGATFRVRLPLARDAAQAHA